MVNIVLAFDEGDEEIGSFNQGCKEDYEDFFSNSDYKNITYITSQTLNSINVQLKAEALLPFVFAAYSHGENHRLFSKEGDYISSTINITSFKDSFFYTVSCHTGKQLGKELVENGCKCYFGYKDLFTSWSGYKEFSDCANFGFFKFLEGISTDEVFGQMIINYNQNIDNLYLNDFLQASLLRANRDGLIKLGENITIETLNSTL